MKQRLKRWLKSVPPLKAIITERDNLIAERDNLRAQLKLINPGHYYSPIPNLREVVDRKARLFDRSLRNIPGVDLNVAGQLELLNKLEPFYGEQPFDDAPSADRRFHFSNEYFSYSDAIILHCMMRLARPKRIIEIGSGFSSFVLLDTNELFFNGNIEITFIEPEDERLRSRLNENDLQACDIRAEQVQSTDLSLFAGLDKGDILFVDSSHVAKIGSDVNHILFEILPLLGMGVLVHFHDVFYPFEYPVEWIESGRYWNEDYMLRAFLQFNNTFKIRFWNHFLGTHHSDRIQTAMPLFMKNIGGSIWLERV